MAGNPHFAVLDRNAWLNSITSSLGNGAIFAIYSGNQPADVSSATTAANVIIAQPLFTATSAFAAAAAGSMTANAIASDTSAVGGTAAWFSLTKSTGTRICDGNISTTGADLNLNSVTITTGATVAITAFTITAAA